MDNIERENNQEQKNNQSETQSEERLELLKTKTKTHLEKAQERLRKTRPVEEEKTINEPQTAQEQPSPDVMPTKTEPVVSEPSEKIESTQPTPSPAPSPIVSGEQVKQELEQALKEKPSLKEVIEPQKTEAEKETKFSYEKPESVPLQDKDEKLEFLKREEIKTMQKDVKSLRELDAKKERERIIRLQAEKKKAQIEQKAKPEPTKEALPKEILIPKPPKRPSPLKKVFVRVGIFILVVFIISFGYWFLSQKQESTIDEEPISQEEEQEDIEEEVEEPEISIPKSLIAVKNTLTFNAVSSENIKNIYSQITTQELTENEFVRIVIKNEGEKYLLSLSEIAQAFQITIPAEILENLKTDTLNLLVYPQEHGKRGVVIAEIKDKEKLKTALTSWENDTITSGLLVSGNKIPTTSVKFKDYAFENVAFRFLTVSMNDLGICYVLFNDYFALSTSFKSIEETIKALKEQAVIAELKNKAGQLFIVGFEGTTVTAELEQFFKKYKPGGVLLLSKNIEDEEQLKTLTADLQTLSRKETGLPLLIAVDQEGGSVSRIGFLKEKTAQSEISTENYAYAVGLKRGEELKSLGINLNLSPVLDNAQDNDFLFERSFQKSTEISGELAKSLIKGQKDVGILTAIKHFPGYVNIDFNPEDKLSTTSLPEISQFQKALEANPEMVMTANVIYQDIDPVLPFSFSSAGIEFLKSNLGSEILIISDDLSQNSLLNNFTLNEIITKPVLSGNDILIFSGWRSSVEQGLDEFFKAIEQKQISEQIINSAFSKINQLKQGLE